MPFVHRIHMGREAHIAGAQWQPSNETAIYRAHSLVAKSRMHQSSISELECLLNGTQVLDYTTIRIPLTNDTSAVIYEP